MIRTYIESLETYKFFQRLFGNSRRTSYGYSENTLAKYQDLLEYKALHNSVKRLNQLHTNESITLGKGIKMGASTTEVRSLFNVKPFVKTFVSNGVRRTILLYKIKMGDQKIKMEAHFYKDQMFFSQIITSATSTSEYEKALAEITYKLGIAGQDVLEKNIIDSDNNCIKISMNQDFAITYFQLSNPFYRIMQEKLGLEFDVIPSNYGIQLQAS